MKQFTRIVFYKYELEIYRPYMYVSEPIVTRKKSETGNSLSPLSFPA